MLVGRVEEAGASAHAGVRKGELHALGVLAVAGDGCDDAAHLKIYVSGTVPYLDLIRLSGGTETLLTRTTLSIRMTTADVWYSVAVRAVTAGGQTTLTAKLWPKGTAEPAAWQATATDSTAAMQGSGWVRLWSCMSSGATSPITTSFDDIRFTTVP